MKIKKNIARNDLIISAILKGFEEKNVQRQKVVFVSHCRGNDARGQKQTPSFWLEPAAGTPPYRHTDCTPVRRSPPRPEFVVNFCDKTRQLLPPTVGENHLAEVTQKFWVVTEGLAYELARIFLDFGSQTDFPKRFLAQVEGSTSHNIVGQDAIKEHSSNIWSQYYLISNGEIV